MCKSSRVSTTGSDPGVASGASCRCVRIHSNDLNHPAQLDPTLNCQLTVEMQWATMGSSTQLPSVRGQTSLVVVLKNCHNFDNRYDVSDFIYLLSFGLHSLIKKARNLHSTGIRHWSLAHFQHSQHVRSLLVVAHPKLGLAWNSDEKLNYKMSAT